MSAEPSVGRSVDSVGGDLGPVGITIGVTGLRSRWSVSPWGSVTPWGLDDAPTVDWFVAADDRWHVPSSEPTVRQSRLDGTPVVETRVRIPDGDAVQRVWAVPDGDGMCVMEFENESPKPFAIALSGGGIITERPVADVPIEGIELPDDTIVMPIGHRAIVRVAVPHPDAAARVRSLPQIPPVLAVVRGWTRVIEQASRLVLPDEALVEAVVAARCDLLLEGPVDVADDPVGFLLDVAELVRCGDDAGAWMLDIVEPAERIARHVADGRFARTPGGADRGASGRRASGRGASDGDAFDGRPAVGGGVVAGAGVAGTSDGVAWGDGAGVAGASDGGASGVVGASAAGAWGDGASDGGVAAAGERPDGGGSTRQGRSGLRRLFARGRGDQAIDATRAEAFDALYAVRLVAERANDDLAVADVERTIARLAKSSVDADNGPVATASFADVRRGASAGRFVRALERRIADGADLLPAGMPTGWLGNNFEVHGVPTVGASTVSFAVRWHGERPAVLWEQHGDDLVTLTAHELDPSWSTSDQSGEALWPTPKNAQPRSKSLKLNVDPDGASFN